MTAALQNYQIRMQRVLDHIDRHLDADLDLDTLSAVAAFSKFHFHRQFTATFGLSVHRYVQLARMKRATRVVSRMVEVATGQTREVARSRNQATPAAREVIGPMPWVGSQPRWIENARTSSWPTQKVGMA